MVIKIMNAKIKTSYYFTIVPYPNPNHLPLGYSCWLWSVFRYTDNRKVAWGTVQHYLSAYTTHASNVVPDLQRQGIYSQFVLPRIACYFGSINSDNYHKLSLGAKRAWGKAGATLHYVGEFYRLTYLNEQPL